jgi:polyphosphate kinase 2 (PPK2 family)
MARICIRITDFEDKKIRENAKKNRLQVTAYLRQLIFDDAETKLEAMALKQQIGDLQEVIEVYQNQISELLLALTTHVRTNENISVAVLRQLDASGYVSTIKGIQEALKKEI